MLRTFRSVRFNIFLGAVIALFSALGTFLPQIPEAPEKVDAFAQAYPAWSRLFDAFNLFNLYQSWWFMGLLGLMAFDVAVCKLWSRPPDLGLVALPPELTDEEEAEKHLARKDAVLRLKPYQAAFTAALPLAEAAARAKGFLSRAGCHIHEDFSVPGGAAFVATKHRLQRWGSYVSHIALVVILAGAMLKGLYGFVEMVPVLEGRSRPMRTMPGWEVHVDKFTVRYYDGTMDPKAFSSELRVMKGGELLGAKTINVNDPLDIGGVRFYQASWGAGGMFRSAVLRVGAREIVLPQRVRKQIPGTPFEVEADVLIPDFEIGPDGRAANASMDLKNPAVRLQFHIGAEKASPLWLFKNEPELCFKEDEEGRLNRASKPPFALAALDPVLFSGIQAAYDPGFKVVMAGAILWLSGMLSLFYLHRRRLWVLIEPGPSGESRVSVGGWSSRGPREYDREFDKLMRAFREAMPGRSDLKLSKNPVVEVTL